MAAAGIASFALLYAPQPLLPQLADTFRLDPGSASLAVSMASAGLAVAVLPLAALSEVVGRRPVIVGSLVLSVLLGALVPFAGDFTTLLVLRGLQGAAIAGFPGVAAAFLAEQLGARGVAGAVGAMVAGNTVGGMLGRLAAGLGSERLGWQGALACSTALSLVCAAVAVLALARHRRSSVADPAAGPTGSAAPARRGARGVLPGLVAAARRPVLLAQFAVAMLGMGTFVALYNAAAFRLVGEPFELAPAIASLVFLAYAVGAVSSSYAGALVRRFGRARSLVGALAATAAGALLTLPSSLPLVLAGIVVCTGGFFAAHAVSSGWAAVSASPAARGQSSGLYTLSYYLGGSVGGTLGSVVYADAGWGALVAVVVLWLALAVHAVRGHDPGRACAG